MPWGGVAGSNAAEAVAGVYPAVITTGSITRCYNRRVDTSNICRCAAACLGRPEACY